MSNHPQKIFIGTCPHGVIVAATMDGDALFIRDMIASGLQVCALGFDPETSTVALRSCPTCKSHMESRDANPG